MKFKTLLVILVLLAEQITAASITLKEALDKKMVSCTFQAARKDSTRWSSSYYGKCMNVHLQNLTKAPVTVSLETGFFIQPEDSSFQRMIVTGNELITLAPATSKSRDFYAMCTQMSNSSPNDKMKYALASKAEGSLLGLVELINTKKYQSDAAQHAVWAITDGSGVGNIYSTNPAELKDLQEFVTKATGQVIPRLPNTIKYNSGIVNGTIYWETAVAQTLSLFIMRPDSTVVDYFFENKPFMAAHQTLNWKFSYKGFPAGVYYVMLIDDKQKVISKRPFIVS